MEKIVYEILDLIEKNGFQAYIVGGYPRDYYLKKRSEDYDICTNATSEQLRNIFSEIVSENFGSLKIKYRGKIIEITTFRIDLEYTFTRTPVIAYTNYLEEDLQRRDFIMNTLCMDKNGNYIDLMGAISDIDNQIIRSVGNPFQKMIEDPLRILRAIRFSSTLGYSIDNQLEEAIIKNISLVEKLSYYRKKEELDKIFLSKRGIDLLKKYELDKVLECKWKSIIFVDCVEAIWAQIDFSNQYPFSKEEKKKIELIRFLVKKAKIEDIELYYYGLEMCSYVSKILKIDIDDLEERYYSLPIHSQKDISISVDRMKEITNTFPSVCYPILEREIISRRLENSKNSIEKFLLSYFVEK